MNTKQLLVLWYGSFILFPFLLAFYSKPEALFQLVVIISILVVILLTYLTFRGTEGINTEQVLKQGVLPIIVLIFFSGFILILVAGLSSQGTGTVHHPIEIDKVEITVPVFRVETYSAGKKAIFSGRIKNNSNRTISRIILRVRIYEDVSNQGPYTIEELTEVLTRRKSISTTPIQTLDEESMKYIGQQIDFEDLSFSNLSVPPGETTSFSIQNSNTKLSTSTEKWFWDYEIIRVW